MEYGLDVRLKDGAKKPSEAGTGDVDIYIYRTGLGAVPLGEKNKVEEKEGKREVEVRVVGRKEYFEQRAGCASSTSSPFHLAFPLCRVKDGEDEKLTRPSQPPPTSQKPNGADRHRRVGVRDGDALSIGKQYVSSPFGWEGLLPPRPLGG